MTRLLIANSRSLLGICPEGNARHSIIIAWQMKPGDILLLAQKPDPGHLEYIAQTLNIHIDSIDVVVAPPGKEANFSPDRLSSPELIETMKDIVGNRSIDSVLYFYLEASIASFMKAIGQDKALQGGGLAEQSGGIMVNSKCLFRMIAGGNNIPVSPGTVVSRKVDAVDILTEIVIEQKLPALVKKDYAGACMGNEIFSPFEETNFNGARRGYVITSKEQIQFYLDDRWEWFTDGGIHSIIVERFYPDSIAAFVEFDITDDAVTFTGNGEMLAEPIADGQIMPAVNIPSYTMANIASEGHRLSEVIQKIGYRGTVSADCIVTPGGEVFFTEINCRITGSTHIYKSIGGQVVGPAWFNDRVLVERHHWLVSGFENAVEKLKQINVAYDPKQRKGVVLSGIFNPEKETIGYTVVGKTLDDALAIENEMLNTYPRADKVTYY